MSNLTAYTNHWHFPLALGSSLAKSPKSTKKQGFVAKNKLQIIALAAFILSTTTLLIGVFNTIMYQSILPNPTTTSAVVVDVSTDVVAITNTTTTTTTTVNTTTTTAAHSAANTDAATSTSSSTSVDIVTTTTAPSCPSMLPYDNGVEIEPSTNKKLEVNLGSFHIWGQNMESGTILVETTNGIMALDKIVFNILVHNYGSGWTFYYRNDSLPEEKEAVGCLFNASVSDVYIFTWKKNYGSTIFQSIVAFNNQAAAYMIRIYTELESDTNTELLEIRYEGDDEYLYFDSSLKPQNVTEQRLITDLTNVHIAGDQITFFDTRNDCGIFKC